MIINIYVFLKITYFQNDINIDQINEDICNNYISCYFNGINAGLKLGGGISDVLFL